MSYPFSHYPLANGKPTCMLPGQLDQIYTTAQCRALVTEARDAAMIRATALNDPTFFQFADAFNLFANGDQAQLKTYGNNRQTLGFQGGCELLSRPETRESLWPHAKQVLYTQLQRYHSNQPSLPVGNETPTLSCYTNGNGKWLCPPNTLGL